MKTLLLLLAAGLFTVINIAIGCYAAVRLGYGPPNWQSALNLIVRLTTLQDYLNAGRDWLDKKAPWMDKYLNQLKVPKPIIIVDTTPIEEEEEPEEEEEVNGSEPTDEQTEESPEESAEEPGADTPESVPAVQVPMQDT